MSDTLTDAAPVEDVAVTPVGDTAPAVGSEVDAGSGDGKFVPVERFNGLMSSFNKAQTRVSELERQLTELRSGLDTKQPEEEKPKPVSDTDIRSEIQELKEMLLTERMKNVRTAVLDEYPAAKPFADLIVADTEEDLRQMAKLIAERVGGIAPNTPTQEAPTQEPTAPETPVVEETPEPPVVGGGTGYDSEAAVEDQVADAIKRRDFGAYLRAKRARLDDSLEEVS